jgi:hypothetical protein
MKPIEQFSFKYIKEEEILLDYIFPVAQTYYPDYNFDEDTGEAYMLPSCVPSIFKKRYNQGMLEAEFTIDEYLKNKELQAMLAELELNNAKFWYLLIFCYDYSWGACIKGWKFEPTPKELITEFINAIDENNESYGSSKESFKLPMSLTLKVGKKKVSIDNHKAIAYMAKFCHIGLDTSDGSARPMNSGLIDWEKSKSSESFSFLAYYFAQMFITAFNCQSQVVEKRKKGANLSDKEKRIISHLLYLTGIVSNESVLADNDYLKALLKQYKDKEISMLSSFYS